MEQKDYKEIGKIMNVYKHSIIGESPAFKSMVNELADYFEKPRIGKRIKVVLGRNTNSEFNREQFLKDCGVQ